MNTHIIPTVFSSDLVSFNKRHNRLKKIVTELHIDICDGRFVPARTILPKDIPTLQPRLVYEAHLMVRNPLGYLDILSQRGFQRVIVHIESFRTKKQVVEATCKIRDRGMEPILAINPSTPIRSIPKSFVNTLLLMGVTPGAEHQSLNPGLYRRCKQIQRMYPYLTVQVDGGVNPQTIRKLACCGIQRFNVGSYINNSKTPKIALKALKDALNKTIKTRRSG